MLHDVHRLLSQAKDPNIMQTRTWHYGTGAIAQHRHAPTNNAGKSAMFSKVPNFESKVFVSSISQLLIFTAALPRAA